MHRDFFTWTYGPAEHPDRLIFELDLALFRGYFARILGHEGTARNNIEPTAKKIRLLYIFPSLSWPIDNFQIIALAVWLTLGGLRINVIGVLEAVDGSNVGVIQ